MATPVATEGVSQQFKDITLGGKSSSEAGNLRITKKGFGWKSKTQSVAVGEIEIKSFQWIRLGATYQLTIFLKAGDTNVKFSGFKDQVLPQFLKEIFNQEIHTLDLCTKGWNWGDIRLQGSSLIYQVDSKPAFELPIADVSQCIVNKSEVVLEFQQNKETFFDSLLEIRFHVPNTNETYATEDEGTTAAQKLHKMILGKADLTSQPTAGPSICTLEKMPVISPRARYDMELFPTFLSMHGPTYNYKIAYSSITRLFHLPRPGGKHVIFVISLSPPLRQGLVQHKHVLVNFPIAEEITVPIKLSSDELKEKYNDQLQPEMKGPMHTVVCRIFKALTNVKITAPGTFRSTNHEQAINCSLKAFEGYLFPMEKSFFFIHKPATYIRFDSISLIEFARVESAGGGSTTTRNFDINVTLKNGGTFRFSNIQKAEYTNLYNYLSEKGIKIQGTRTDEFEKLNKIDHESDDDDDEGEEADDDFVDHDGDGDGDGDVEPDYNDDDDEDEDLDEDFEITKEEQDGDGEKKRKSSKTNEKDTKRQKL